MAKAHNGIRGWLGVTVLVMFLSLLSALSMADQRIALILVNNASSGVYISLALLVPYITLLVYTIYLIFRRREDAVNMYISSSIIGGLFVIWFFIIGQMIYTPELFKLTWMFSVFKVIWNIAIYIAIATYLLKSKRVKNTLNKK